MSAYPWSVLGIAATGDAKAIRSAYAGRIKAMDLDADVAGYAELRGARDMALRLAKTMPQDAAPPPAEEWDAAETAPETATEPVEDTSATPQWPHAAPTLDGEWASDPALSARPEENSEALIGRVSPDFSITADAPTGHTIAPASPDPFAAPLLEGHDGAETVGQDALQSPFARLAAMLDPDGPAGLAPLDEAEEARALALLGTVLDAVHHADITQQDEMENWLAGLLAQSWPRSAPLLDPAEAAFAWSREWGKVDARPAIEYLGARLRGYRFQTKVMQPGHRYHKAWTELARPGRAGPLRFLRANGSDVRQLLTGIRKHFPELEDHLDPQRVGSWEEANAWPTGLIVLFGLILLGLLVSFGDPQPNTRSPSTDPSTDTIASPIEPTEVDRTFDPAVVAAFGEGHDLAWLRGKQPDLAWTIVTFGSNRLQAGGDVQETIPKAVETTRQLLYLDGRTLTGKDFENVMRLRLDLLKAGQARDTATCLRYMDTGQLPASVPVPEPVRAREVALAASFAERSLLPQPKRSGPTRASVSGALVAKVIKATKLDRAQVEQAMQGTGSDSNRCAVSIALLEATLAWKGDGRRAILLTL